MQVHVIDNTEPKLARVLADAIEEAHDVRVAVAYVSLPGFSRIESALRHSLEGGAAAEFLVGFEPTVTEATALRALRELGRAHPKLGLLCCRELTARRTFHPKLYLARRDEQMTAVVGSSNLTTGGLERNFEINLLVNADASEEVASDLSGAYNHLKFAVPRVVPDEELLGLYEEACKRSRRATRAASKDPAMREVMARFKEKAQTLPQPEAAPDDLSGWQRLVYEHVPDGEFTNRDIYAYEAKFQGHYPENRFIADKIRQILQQLEKMGLLEHPRPGRWRKK